MISFADTFTTVNKDTTRTDSNNKIPKRFFMTLPSTMHNGDIFPAVGSIVITVIIVMVSQPTALYLVRLPYFLDRRRPSFSNFRTKPRIVA